MSKLRLGIIGTGGICNHKHLPSLEKVADKVEVVALCDLIREKAVQTAKDFHLDNAAIYTDYKELLADPTIDVVHVCTPNVAHCQITVDAFEAGKHVLCEKPMAATTEDAQKMMEAWRKSGKKFTIGYQNRFRYDVQVLKKPATQAIWERSIMEKPMQSAGRQYPRGACSRTNPNREAAP